jgi:hypothetical protein
MSVHLGDRLPARLVARLGSGEWADRAIVIGSIDARGYPHPAMLSPQEFVVLDEQTIRVETYESSRTATNLETSKRLTAIVADVDGVFYIKSEVVRAHAAANARIRFDVRVIEVLEDTPAPGEAARLTTGIRFARRADG